MDHIVWHQIGLFVDFSTHQTPLTPPKFCLKSIRPGFLPLCRARSLSTGEAISSQLSCNNDGFRAEFLCLLCILQFFWIPFSIHFHCNSYIDVSLPFKCCNNPSVPRLVIWSSCLTFDIYFTSSVPRLVFITNCWSFPIFGHTLFALLMNHRHIFDAPIPMHKICPRFFAAVTLSPFPRCISTSQFVSLRFFIVTPFSPFFLIAVPLSMFVCHQCFTTISTAFFLRRHFFITIYCPFFFFSVPSLSLSVSISSLPFFHRPFLAIPSSLSHCDLFFVSIFYHCFFVTTISS